MDPIPGSSTPDIHFMYITKATMNQVCDLSDTLSPPHQTMVAPNM
jgi:hypothetical protein